MQDGYIVYSILAVLRGESNEDPQIYIDPQVIVAQNEQSALEKFITQYPDIEDDKLPLDVIITTYANTSTHKYQIMFDDDHFSCGPNSHRWDN